MKHLLAAAALAAAFASTAALATEVGVSVQISQPGVYGRIDIGRFPQPQLVVTQPVIIARPVYAYQTPDPMYLWVPQGHRKNWKKHCGYYSACGVPVYFVQDNWYGEHVHPQGKGHKGEDNHGNGKGKGKGKSKDD